MTCHTVISSILSSTKPITPVSYNCSYTMCNQNFSTHSTETVLMPDYCLLVCCKLWLRRQHCLLCILKVLQWWVMCKMKVRMITETATVYRKNVSNSSTTNKHFLQCQILRAWEKKIWRKVTTRILRAAVPLLEPLMRKQREMLWNSSRHFAIKISTSLFHKNICVQRHSIFFQWVATTVKNISARNYILPGKKI